MIFGHIVLSNIPVHDLKNCYTIQFFGFCLNRNQIIASYNRLRGVLPLQSNPKEGSDQPTHAIQEVLSASGSKYNRVTLVNRAKLYVMHLEEVVDSLIKESNSNRPEDDTVLIDDGDYSREFESVADIHQNFLRNYQIGNPIEAFDFECFGPRELLLPCAETDPSKGGLVNVNSGVEGNSSAQFVGPVAHTAILIPLKVSPGKPIPCIIDAYPPSPAGHSVDLGFVSAGNASQDTVTSDK